LYSITGAKIKKMVKASSKTASFESRNSVEQSSVVKAYERAKEVLKLCATRNGFYASAGKDGYNAVWARDSMISSLGACLVDDSRYKKLFKKTFMKSLKTLAKNQSKLGQIPNAVDKWEKRKSHVDFQSIDSSLWFIIGSYIYMKKYGRLLYKKQINKALVWLSYRDWEEDDLLEQLPTTDWQDAFPHKYGHTINTQALYYKVLKLVKQSGKAGKLKRASNEIEDIKLWDKNYYWAYRWKNHGKYKEIGDWFASLGNLLAIVFDLADENKSKKIISYIKKKKIDQPYPVKTIWPPIKKSSKYWKDYFNDCDARKPFHYSNAGIWGYIGCFYVLSLIKLKKFKQAEKELEKLAKLNLKADFPEWTNPSSAKRTMAT